MFLNTVWVILDRCLTVCLGTVTEELMYGILRTFIFVSKNINWCWLNSAAYHTPRVLFTMYVKHVVSRRLCCAIALNLIRVTKNYSYSILFSMSYMLCIFAKNTLATSQLLFSKNAPNGSVFLFRKHCNTNGAFTKLTIAKLGGQVTWWNSLYLTKCLGQKIL